jgi:hypothetical protein
LKETVHGVGLRGMMCNDKETKAITADTIAGVLLQAWLWIRTLQQIALKLALKFFRVEFRVELTICIHVLHKDGWN